MQTHASNVLVRVVDDDPEIRETLSLMLEVAGLPTKAFESAEDFLVDDQPSVPGCVLLDVQLGGMSGVDLQLEMAERGYSLPIIFVTGHASVPLAVDAMRRGAFDFLEKPVNPTRLLASIRAAAAQSEAQSRRQPTQAEVKRAMEGLTERQREILRAMLDGTPTRGIAVRLGISQRTVQGHRVTIYRKFGLHALEQIQALETVIRRVLNE